tara:strand:+ start:111 stop:338 length:228 start_codon:yes stop_codon:yes gene_type:complete
MLKENCWVWFKGSDGKKGSWKPGFRATKDANTGILIENPSYVSCRVPEWRVKTTEPLDPHSPPEVPEGSFWKLPV